MSDGTVQEFDGSNSAFSVAFYTAEGVALADAKKTADGDYDALEMCFMGLARKSRMPIAMPYKIGCGRGGGDWDGIVYPMIQDIFKTNDKLTDNTYKLYQKFNFDNNLTV